MPSTSYAVEYDAVVKTVQMYLEGCKQGKSGLMRPAFHANAGFFGYAGGELAMGTPFLFEWIDKNGPSPHIRPRFISVDVLESVAAVRLEVDGWSGALAGPEMCMSDIFTLLKTRKDGRSSKRHFTGAHENQTVRSRTRPPVTSQRLSMLDSTSQAETLESWKQIAAYLKRSERTVRRWESLEGLPVHRHGHRKQDTVFARIDEIDHWVGRRTRRGVRTTPRLSSETKGAAPAALAEQRLGPNTYLAEHDAIARTIDRYIAGGRAGDSNIMRPAFHPEATMAGYCQGVEYSGSIQHLFDWITANGPAPDITPRFARIEIFETIAIVHLEVHGWSGTLAGSDSRISEVFTLLKRDGEWMITQKTFHWHDI